MSLPTPAGLVWWHPAALVATGFGIGHLPWVPGSAAIIAFALGVWASARVAAASGVEDPRFVVIDEIAAQWLVLLAAPLDPRGYAAAFLLFRVFDILKPWPIRWIERRVRGGLGIMVDDIGAAIYAVVLLLIGEGMFGVRP